MRRWVQSPEYEALARIIVKARQDAHLTQREVAARLSKPPSYVAKIEARERRIDVVEFVAIVQAIGADERQLFDELIRSFPAHLVV
jgi:transcriptional regulator with XRE-family HTH domain